MPGATGNRHIRVAEAIREVLAEKLMRGLKTPGVGFCTITGVDVTKDLAQAKIYVSVFGPAAEQEKTLEALRKAGGYLRGEVGRELRLRLSPSLIFSLDNSVETGARVSDAINRARADDAQLATMRGEKPAPPIDPAKNPAKPLEAAHGEDHASPGKTGHAGGAGEPPAR
jgi:ribosome-binding factor A